MNERRGILFGTQSFLRRLWAHRDGRLLLVGLALIAVPLTARDAMYRVIAMLPQPTKSSAFHFVWINSNFHEYPALAAMACGLLLIVIAVLRALITSHRE